MNARTYRSVSEWWEWILAGSLALASCAALVLLLLTVARMQAREAWQAKRLSADTTGTCVDGIGTPESGTSKWLATGTQVPSCRHCQAGRAQRGVADNHVWSDLSYETTVVTAGVSGGGAAANSARTSVIIVSVVLAWLLGMRIIIGPLHPSHHVRRDGRRSRSF